MRRIAPAAISLILGATAGPAASATPGPAAGGPPAAFSAAECEVFAHELAFAKSVADHDAEAFTRLVAPDAAFAAGSPRPQRGREAIVAGWGPIIRGEGIRLEWYPVRTTVVGDIAWSTGPALAEETPDGTTHARLSMFQSVWRRGGDGHWQVVFDGGTPGKEADAAAIAAFRAARPTGCPAR